MDEKIPTTETELTPDRYAALAERLSGYAESLPFPGIEEHAYPKLKAESDEFPGYATHIDVLIQRFKAEGLKVVMERGKAFIVPFGSDNVEDDSILPRFLAVTDDMDTNLKTLIVAGKQPG